MIQNAVRMKYSVFVCDVNIDIRKAAYDLYRIVSRFVMELCVVYMFVLGMQD